MSVDPIHLADIPFFSRLDDEQRHLLAARLDTVHELAGKTMWMYGDPGDAAYIVRKGVVEISTKNDTGERLALETARVGDFFGEISLLDGGPRTASVVVIEDLEAILVDHGDLEEFLRVCPAAINLLAASGRRIRETAKLLRHSRVARHQRRSRGQAHPRAENCGLDLRNLAAVWSFCSSIWAFSSCGSLLNAGPLARTSIGGFDAFPFGLLTMVVSLEAIILSVFVLLSQNRQVARDRVRNDIEYQVNLKAELEIGHLHEKVDHFHQEVMRRLSVLEKPPSATALVSASPARPPMAATHPCREVRCWLASAPLFSSPPCPCPCCIETRIAALPRNRSRPVGSTASSTGPPPNRRISQCIAGLGISADPTGSSRAGRTGTFRTPRVDSDHALLGCRAFGRKHCWLGCFHAFSR